MIINKNRNIIKVEKVKIQRDYLSKMSPLARKTAEKTLMEIFSLALQIVFLIERDDQVLTLFHCISTQFFVVVWLLLLCFVFKGKKMRKKLAR